MQVWTYCKRCDKKTICQMRSRNDGSGHYTNHYQCLECKSFVDRQPLINIPRGI